MHKEVCGIVEPTNLSRGNLSREIGHAPFVSAHSIPPCTPNLATKIMPTKIARLKLSGKFPMGLGILSLRIKIVL